MIEDINKRIIEVMVRTDHSKSTFAKALDVSLPLMTHITSGRNKPGLDLIQKLLSNFQQISPDWLLLGAGSMYREEMKAPDYSGIISLLDHSCNEISRIKEEQSAVIQYHKILLDEVLHLKEMDLIIHRNEENLEFIKTKMETVKAELIDK